MPQNNNIQNIVHTAFSICLKEHNLSSFSSDKKLDHLHESYNTDTNDAELEQIEKHGLIHDLFDYILKYTGLDKDTEYFTIVHKYTDSGQFLFFFERSYDITNKKMPLILSFTICIEYDPRNNQKDYSLKAHLSNMSLPERRSREIIKKKDIYNSPIYMYISSKLKRIQRPKNMNNIYELCEFLIQIRKIMEVAAKSLQKNEK